MPKKKYDVERGFISKLLETKDMLTIKENQIKVAFFTGPHKQAYNYIQNNVMSNGEVPSIRAFTQKFPTYDLEEYTQDTEYGGKVVGTEENLKFWCDEVRTRVKHNTVADLLEKSIGMVQDFNTEDAYSLIKKQVAFIESEVTVSTSTDITKDTQSRVDAYKKKKENKGMLGYSTGFKHFDFLTKGLKNETLTTIIAGTGVGKTWLEILIGCYCQLNGIKVLQLVTEMSEEIMKDRYEAMLFSMCYGELNYNKFKSGMLDPSTEKKFFKFLIEDLPNFTPLVIATATSPMGVSAEIDKEKPDIVFIDGVYLMEDDQGAKDDWLRVAHITRDLKKLAKRAHKPIVINTQADKNTSKKTGPELGSIMFTQAIGQDSDDVISMYRDEIMINDNEMCIKILKQREGMLGKVMLTWDFRTMTFEEIYGETNEDANNVDTSDVEFSNDTTKKKDIEKNLINID